MEKKQRLTVLLDKYKSNSLTKPEYRELLDMISDSENLGHLDRLIVDDWENLTTDFSDTGNTDQLRRRTPSYRSLLTYAAAVLVMLSLALLLWRYQATSEPYTVYETTYSEVLEVKLPDGSWVTLNANSRLHWDNDWKDQKSRRTILEGEAFFDIKNLQNNTGFKVEMENASVDVLGTSFNAVSRNEKVEVYLQEGRVHFSPGHDSATPLDMEPGQRVKFDAKSQQLVRTENETMITSASWKIGVLNFKDMAFSEVLDNLTTIYGKTIRCEDEDLLRKQIYLGVPYSDWEAVRQALALSLDITIVESGDTVEITSNE